MCQNDKEQLQDLAQQLAEAQAHLQRIGAEKAAIEARFRIIAETTSVAIFIVERMHILYANDAARNLTGYSRDELLNMELWQFAHPTYQQVLRQNGLKQPWAENVPNRFELRVVTRAGEERWWDVTTGSIEYDGKSAFVVTAFDITERDRAEKALQKAKEELEVRVVQRTADLREANEALRLANEQLCEQAEELEVTMEELTAQNDELRAARQQVEAERQRYQELFDFAPGGYLVTDQNGTIREANRAAGEMLNVRPDRLVGKPLTVFVAEQEHQTLYAQLTQLQQGQETRQWEMRLQPREGTPFPALIDVVPMRDVQGQLVGCRWLLRDITERKQAEKEIASLAKFPSENPNPILRLAPDGIVLYANEASAALLQEWSCAVGGYAPEFWRSLVAAAFTSRSRETVDVECDERVYSFFVVPITEAGYINLYGRDITERKRAEEALHRLNRTLSARSHSDQALMRASNEAEFMQEVCKIVVEDCGHAMVWIGFAEDDEAKSVRPVAYAGFEEGYLETLHIAWADTERSRGPTGTAIRTGKPSFCRNMVTDPNFTPWRAEALKRGYASSLVLPMLDQGRAFGALNIYFREPDPFTEDEIALLSGLADDLAYGIKTLRLRAAHAQAEAALRESEERARDQAARLQAVLDAAPAIIWVAHDRECRTISGNRASQELLRVPEGTNVSKSGPALERLAHYRVFKGGVELALEEMPIQRVAASGQGLSDYAMEIVFDDGTVRSLLGNVTPVLDSAGQPNGAIAAFVDITDRKRAEEERECLLEENSQQRRLLETLFEADPDGLAVVIGNELVVQLANPAYQAFTPHPTENPVGQHWDQVWAGAVAPEVASAIHRVMVTGEPADEESQKRVFPDGQTHYFSFHARRLRWNTEYAALIVLQETTAIEEARRRASQAAQEAQRRAAELDAIITSIADGVMIHDMDGNIVRMNPAAERIMGYSPEERKLPLAERTTKVIQLTSSDGQPLTDARDLPVSRALRGEIVGSNVMRVHHSRTGKLVWVSMSAAPIRTPDGAMLGAVSTITDITELRQTQQRLEQSNERLQAQTEELEVQTEELQVTTQELSRARDELELRVQERTAELAQANVELRLASAYNRSLIEASLDPLVTIGPDGKINDVNTATELATGRSGQELIGTDFGDYFTEPDKAQAGYRQVFEKGLVRDYPLEIRHRDGHATPVLYNASVYKDEVGRVMGVFAAARDIRERKRAEEAVRLANAYNRSLIEASLDPLVTFDPDGKITDVNAATEHITGCSRQDLIGTDFSDYFTEPEKARAGYQQVFREGLVRDYALELRHRDGHVTSVLYNASIYRDEAGQVIGVFAAARDITARMQAEAQLKRYNEELRALSSAERNQRRLAETLSAANLALTQTLSLETVMETLLDYVKQLVPYDSANVMLLEAESRLSVRAARGYERWVDANQVRAIAFDVQANPVFNELFTTRKSMLVPDTRTHPGWQVQPGAEHVHSWIGVPLMAGGNVIGVYSLDKTEPGFFTQEHVRQAEMLVGQAAVAIQNAWLFEQVRAGRERLQSLSRRLVEVQEAERHYVARELHDEVGQALTSLKFGLSQLEPEADLAQHTARVAELKRMTDDVLESLHRLAMNLRPVSLDHLGLVPALDQYVRAIGDRYGLIAQFKAVDMSQRLSPTVETALYRIVQEALTNVVRHSRATRADVLLERRGDQVIVVVEDDGVGFDAQAARLAQSGHLGLVGMQERAEMLGGSFVVESAPGAGTTVVVEVPHVHSYPHR